MNGARCIIETKGLTKRFGNFTAVDGVNLHVDEGEVYGLLGPNGAGKSTMIRMLTTLTTPTGGSASVAGHDVAREAERVRSLVGFVSEKMIMYERLTVYENLRLFAKLYNVPSGEIGSRIDELLRVVDMSKWKDAQIGKFSTGMKQRINVIRALLSYPKVVFMDEPTLGLDPQSTVSIRAYIKRLNEKEGLTIVLTTHIMSEADMLCGRIGLIDRGHIVAEGTPAGLKGTIAEKGRTVVEVELAGPVPDAVRRLKALPGVAAADLQDDRLRVIVGHENGYEEVVEGCRRAGLHLRNATVRLPSLEDVFLHYTGRAMVGEVKEKMSGGMRPGWMGGPPRSRGR